MELFAEVAGGGVENWDLYLSPQGSWGRDSPYYVGKMFEVDVGSGIAYWGLH